MGAFSRNKGSREERGLVNYLNLRGYEARRIPLSGAMKGYKHDVIATKDGTEYTFEMKSRKDAFIGIYTFYNKSRQGENVVRVVLPVGLVAFGTDFEAVKKGGILAFTPSHASDQKVVNRIANLDKLRAGADFLVCKNNGLHRLFFKFWD